MFPGVPRYKYIWIQKKLYAIRTIMIRKSAIALYVMLYHDIDIYHDRVYFLEIQLRNILKIKLPHRRVCFWLIQWI